MIGRLKKSSNQRMTCEYDLNARSAVPDVIGGGILFQFDLENAGGQPGKPEILLGNHGRSWGHPGATRLETHFNPPLASIYFERGRKSEIRACFYQGAVPPGQPTVVVNLDILDDVAIGPATAERFGLDDYAKWPRQIPDWNRSPLL